MKNYLLFFLILVVLSCKENTRSTNVEIDKFQSNEKYKSEAQRDVESKDASIDANQEDFVRIGIELFPSFEEAVRIIVDLDESPARLDFSQITQTLENYLPTNFRALDSI